MSITKTPAANGAAKKTRARTDKGAFIADDPSTPNVNEAWVGGALIHLRCHQSSCGSMK